MSVNSELSWNLFSPHRILISVLHLEIHTSPWSFLPLKYLFHHIHRDLFLFFTSRHDHLLSVWMLSSASYSRLHQRPTLPSLPCCWSSILLVLLLTFLSVLLLQFLSQNYHQTSQMLSVLSFSYNSFPSVSSFCTCGIPVHMQDTLLVCELVHKIYIPSHPWSELIPSYFPSSVCYLILFSFFVLSSIFDFLICHPLLSHCSSLSSAPLCFFNAAYVDCFLQCNFYPFPQ